MLSSLNPGQSFSSNEKSVESGNGGGYEGKPDGTYYFYIPSYTCEGQPSAAQVTEIKNGQAVLYSGKGNQCADETAPTPIHDVDVSPFQTDFISVKDALFKRYDIKPTGIPDNLAEVLCRDDFEKPTFEIVSHYDREKNEALTRVYLPGRKVPDFSVSRILSADSVRYVAGDLSFRVDLSKPAFAERKFAGQIEATTIAGISSRSLTCVIGGSIDTSKWSMKALTNVDAGPFQLMKNGEILFFSEVSRHYFTSTLYSYVTHLFKISLEGVVGDFSKEVFGDQYDVIYNNGKAGDVLNLFSAKLASEMWPSLFFYDSRNGKARRLTNLQAGAPPEAYSLNQPVLTANQHLFFDTQVLQTVGGRKVSVRDYDFSDDSIREVASLGAWHDTGYTVLPKSGKMLVFWRDKGGIKNVIEIYDSSSRASSDLEIGIPTNCYLNGYDVKARSDESGILVTEVCDDTKSNVVEVSLADGNVKLVGALTHISWTSEDNSRLIMTDAAKMSIAYDVRTGKTVPLPIDPRFGYDGTAATSTDFSLSEFSSKVALKDDRWLYGFGGTLDAPKMYQIDLANGAIAPVCENAAGKKMFLGILPNQKVFVFAYDASMKVYRFYQVKSPTECVRINEFPSEYPNVPKLMPTNIGFGLLLGLPLSATSNNQSPEAVFVPIDGRPPLKFNPGVKGNWQMEVSVDRNRIVLRGPDSTGFLRVFSFDL